MGLENVAWLGHDTFRITGEKVLYTDPFRIKNSEIADLILITHEHYDHCSPEDLQKLQGPDTVTIGPADCANKISDRMKGSMVIVQPGDKIVASGISIEVVPSYNMNKQFHTRDRGWVGYIFTINNKRFYIAGDTDHIPEMKHFRDIDVAFLPVSGTYVMTAEEAVKAALDIKPKIASPMHYGSIVGTRRDAEIFAEKLKGIIDVAVLEQI